MVALAVRFDITYFRVVEYLVVMVWWLWQLELILLILGLVEYFVIMVWAVWNIFSFTLLVSVKHLPVVSLETKLFFSFF